MARKSKLQRHLSRWYNRHIKQRRSLYIASALCAIIVLTGYLHYIQQPHMNLNYTQLLTTIATGESHGNYNAYFGNSTNQTIKFTDMSVSEVLAWQHDFVAQGNASSAVGKYQFIDSTLSGLVQKLHIDPHAKFDPALQDRLAIELLKKRGVEHYAQGEISKEQFAYNLSKEWASLPRVIGSDPSASYYAGDGLNNSHVSITDVLGAIETIK